MCLLAGDLCPLDSHHEAFQAAWLDTAFRAWLEKVPARKIVATAGNHDWVFQTAPRLVPRDLPWTYLQDSGCDWEGLKLWGSPHTPTFYDWAFNLDELDLVPKWAAIPEGTDVLVLHGPPFGYGDTTRSGYHAGSPSLIERIRHVAPRVTVFGHIHEARGEWRLSERSVLANVSLVNSRYEPAYPVWEYELDRGA